MTNIQAIVLLKGLEQSLDDYCELNDEAKTAFRMAITALEVFGNSEQLPSAQLEHKKGEWLELGNSNHNYICSLCGRMLVGVTDGKNRVAKKYPFCHCGADMRGEQE